MIEDVFGMRACLTLSVLLAAAGGTACSDDASGGSGGSGGSAGGAGSGGSSAGGSPGVGGGSGGAGTSGSGGTAGSGGAGEAGAAGGGFSEVGVCGQRGESTVAATSFTGFEELYLIGEEGFGDDICVIRYEVTRVGEAPGGCVDAENNPCLWTHLVEFSNPSVVTDLDSVCENSELALDAAAIAAIDGSQAAYGFVEEFAGHNSVLMKQDATLGTWDAYGNATWDPETNAFRFDRRDGFCDY